MYIPYEHGQESDPALAVEGSVLHTHALALQIQCSSPFYRAMLDACAAPFDTDPPRSSRAHQAMA